MYLRKEKSSLWTWTGIFFALMLLFTLLSRAVYQSGVTVVTTAAPANGTIAHHVQVRGKTVQNQELAVTTVSGLRVASVLVNEGQQVKQGEVLFTLDLDFLQETIQFQQQEMRKQQLSIQDAWSQSNASQKQRSNAQAQAEENYHSAVSGAQTTLERAQRDLERAEEALDAFYNGVSAEETEKALLESAYTDAAASYDAAVLALDQLQQDIQGRIQAAIDQANAELLQAPAAAPSEPLGEDAPEAAPPSIPEPRTLTPAEQEQIAQSVRAEYAQALSDAEAAVSLTRTAMEDAQGALTAFRQNQNSAPVRSEQDLIQAVETAQERYDDAVTALKNAKTTYGRAIESAQLPVSSSSSAQIGQITYEQMDLTLGKLTALQEAEGKILAPVDGIVTGSFLQTGEKTTDATAVLLADLRQGCKFSGLVTQEQSPYIGVGDKVVIQSESNGKLYKDLPVTTFSTTEDSGRGYRITVQLPPGTLSLGASADLQFTRKSQPYALCVPLSALRLDAQNQPFVLVVEEVTTVLGPQLQAKKVSVTVLDQNETTAALAEGALGRDQQIIIGSDKAVAPGSRVRVA